MKIIKKNVYYCDFCKKKSLRSLAKHEKHCTGNPDRICQLCDNPPIRPIIEKYRPKFDIHITGYEEFESLKVEYFEDFTLDDIRAELDYKCPICLLTIIRALGINRWYFGGKFKFDYKAELAAWWDAVNQEELRNEYYGYG